MVFLLPGLNFPVAFAGTQPGAGARKMKLSGRSIIGFQPGAVTKQFFQAMNPRSGESLEPSFFAAAPNEVDKAASLAHQAFATDSKASGRDKGAFLRKIASNIESLAGAIVERAGLETALPKVRLQGETARTCGQLRLFAQVVEEGSWVTARIDRPDQERKPAP